MIANYKDDEIHAKHMDYTTEFGSTINPIYDGEGNFLGDTKGISLADRYTTDPLASNIDGGSTYGSIIHIKAPCGSITEIFIPSITSGASNAGNIQPNFYIRSRNDMYKQNENGFSEWRKVAFADECPFPVGFSFSSIRTDRAVKNQELLENRYPGALWKSIDQGDDRVILVRAK